MVIERAALDLPDRVMELPRRTGTRRCACGRGPAKLLVTDDAQEALPGVDSRTVAVIRTRALGFSGGVRCPVASAHVVQLCPLSVKAPGTVLSPSWEARKAMSKVSPAATCRSTAEAVTREPS